VHSTAHHKFTKMAGWLYTICRFASLPIASNFASASRKYVSAELAMYQTFLRWTGKCG